MDEAIDRVAFTELRERLEKTFEISDVPKINGALAPAIQELRKISRGPEQFFEANGPERQNVIRDAIRYAHMEAVEVGDGREFYAKFKTERERLRRMKAGACSEEDLKKAKRFVRRLEMGLRILENPNNSVD